MSKIARKHWRVVVAVLGPLAALVAIGTFLYDRVISRAVPIYDVTIDVQPQPANLDTTINIAVATKKDGALYYDVDKCTAKLDEVSLPESSCRWSIRPESLHLDASRAHAKHTLIVSVWSGGQRLKDSVPIQLTILPFRTPQIECAAPCPVLFLGESVRLAARLPSGDDRALAHCDWPSLDSTDGVVASISSNGCTAEYRAPDSMKVPGTPMQVSLRASATIAEWSDVGTRPLVINVAAPEEYVQQYVLETSARMRGTLFDVAFKKIESELRIARHESGYIGVRVFGGGDCADRSKPLIPLDLLHSGSKLDRLQPGPSDTAHLADAWEDALDDYEKLRTRERLENPRYVIVNLIAGSDNCEGGAVPKYRPPMAAVLSSMNDRLRAKGLEEEARQYKLIDLVIIAGDSKAWEEGRTSEAYANGHMILVWTDEREKLGRLLGDIAALRSVDDAALAKTCDNLLVVAGGDERGKARVRSLCDVLRRPGRRLRNASPSKSP